jgi:ADP-heptose:LPS heptosyltransferase
MEPNLPAARPIWLRPGPRDQSRIALAAYSVRMRIERWGRRHLDWLNRMGARFTVRDLYGAPGDTLLAAIVARQLKERWPGLRLNFITRNPDLVQHDPNFSQINAAPGLFGVDFWYYDLQTRRDPHTNLLAPTFAALGLGHGEYRGRVYLTEAERAGAREKLARLPRPWLAVSTLSAQPVKNWPLAQWRAFVPELARRGSLVHLGDAREPVLPGTRSFAGQTSKRESLALLAECDLFIGPVTFLMHAANGLDVPAVVIFGGSHTPANAGYAENINLYAELPCSGCWLTGHPGSECPHGLACMAAITPGAVLAAVDEMLARRRASAEKSATVNFQR